MNFYEIVKQKYAWIIIVLKLYQVCNAKCMSKQRDSAR